MLETLRDLGHELLSAFTDIALIAGDEDYFIAHMRTMGWDVTAVPPAFQSLGTAGQRIVDLLSAEDLEDELVLGLLEATVRIVDAVNKLQTAPQSGFPTPAAASEYWSTIAREFIDSLVVDYLNAQRPVLGAAFKLLGLVRETPQPSSATRVEYMKREVRWETIGTLLSDPKQGFKETFDWTGAPRLRDAVSAGADLLQGVGLELRLQPLTDDLKSFLAADALAPDAADDYVYDLQWDPSIEDEDAQATFGVMIYVRPAAATRAAGITFLPYARFSGSEEFDLSERLAITLKGQVDFTKGLALTLVPGAPVLFESGFIGGASFPPAEALVGLKLKPDESGEIRLFGQPDTTNFSIGALGVSAGARSGNGGAIDALIDVALDNAKFVLKAGPNDADSFLASVLPKDGLAATFSLGMRLSSVTGFHLSGSGGLEAKFPSKVQLGPIELQGVTVGLRPQGGAIDLNLGATIAAKLGPLAAVVENVGLKISATFPAARDGNLGPLNIAPGFKPPNGVGLSLDLAVIKGGGYLFLDYDRGEYAGALEFTLINFISIKAVGIVQTKMPDGSKGFSLLLVLTAEFNPGLQLSFGFTLIGVGGLVGLNRSMRFEPILEGVKTGAITGVMFPKDVVANAPRIISDLRNFFPPQTNTFLIGPMVKIGWGTPTLISVSMGVIIEIPGNIAILGVLEMTLPDKDAPILVLNVAFAGGIDFQGKRIFFFASLFDSRILTMTIEGGMGFYLSYGDDPVFVITVGGFHPRFSPPALPFPTPDRVAITVLSTPVARIRVETYFAVTSNTAQFGARADLFFGVSSCEVSGFVSFDALFQFKPLYFIIEVSGSVSLKIFGMGLFSVRLHFSLEGVTPWRARGSGSISFLFFDVSAHFDVTWGDEVTTVPQLVALLPLLEAEVRKADVWKQAPPPAANLLVSLRPITPNGADLVMHPLGAIELSQRLLPLDKALDKFGEQAPSDVKRARVRIDDPALGNLYETREQFAPAQFENLDAAAKLSRKSYEPMPSGMAIGAKGRQYRAPRIVRRRVRYEEEIIDSNYKRAGVRFNLKFAFLFDFLRRGSALSLSPLSARTKKLTQPFEDTIVVRASGYAVARQSDNAVYVTNAIFASESEAHDHLKSLGRSVQADLHVVPAHELAA